MDGNPGLFVLGILILVIGLAVSIGLHEIGHLLPAKLFRVRVTQYMIGFGKTIWSRRKGETEYGVKLLPLGGYISMIGMYPPARDTGRDPAKRTGFLTALIDDARKASGETVPEGEEHRAFYRLPVWKKIIVMLGGPTMNLLLAIVFFAILVSGIGLALPSTTLGSVSACLKPAGSASTECTAEDPHAPASAAGLKPGDRVVAVNGAPVTSWETFRDTVSQHPGEQLRVDITRDGQRQTLTVTPAANERAVVDELGRPVKTADGRVKTETVGMIGATPANEVQRQPLTAVPKYVDTNIRAVLGLFAKLPQRMVDVWNAAFGNEKRDPNGPISVVGVGRIAGEIVSLDKTPVLSKVSAIVGLLASLNVALFVFNLVPLLPLDGGHIAGALYEGAKRRLYRLFGKPDPGPVDTARMVPVTLVVVALLGAMTLLLVYADLVKPVSLFG